MIKFQKWKDCMKDESKRRRSALEKREEIQSSSYIFTEFCFEANVFLKTTISKNVVSPELLRKDLLNLTWNFLSFSDVLLWLLKITCFLKFMFSFFTVRTIRLVEKPHFPMGAHGRYFSLMFRSSILKPVWQRLGRLIFKERLSIGNTKRPIAIPLTHSHITVPWRSGWHAKARF